MYLEKFYLMLFIVTFVASNNLKAQEPLSWRNDAVLVNTKSDSVHTQLLLITYRSKNGRKLSYNAIPLSNPNFDHLINEYPIADKRNILMEEFRKMNRYHKRHVVELVVGFSLTGVIMLCGTASNINNGYMFHSALVTSAIVLTTALPLSIIVKHKYLKKRRQLVNLFNNPLL